MTWPSSACSAANPNPNPNPNPTAGPDLAVERVQRGVQREKGHAGEGLLGERAWLGFV